MKLFFHEDLSRVDSFEPEPEEIRHIRASRIPDNDTVYFTDGNGLIAECRISSEKKTVLVNVIDKKKQELSGPGLTIVIAPTKNTERIEWFVEKAVETGIRRIIFSSTQNSERYVMKTERLKRLAIAAIKQSLKFHLPEIVIAGKFMKEENFNSYHNKLIAHCNPEYDRKFIHNSIVPGEDVLIAIGPEGDFSREEIEWSYNNGFTGISLGNARLRTETAALYAVMDFSIANNQSE